MSHVLERLPEYALGVLSPGEAAGVTAHLGLCRRCADEAKALQEATVAIAIAMADAPIEPSRSLRARILAGTATKGRLASYVGNLAHFFDIESEKARALLEEVDEPSAWEAGPLPGVGLLHLNGGPRVAMADCGLVRFPAGIDWPLHRHIGDEAMLIVQGGLVEADGTVYRAGSVIEKLPGTEHAFKILPDEDCLCAVIIHEGIEMPPGTPLTLG